MFTKELDSLLRLGEVQNQDAPPAVNPTDPRGARENATAIVLAGGKSSRMGVDKCLLPLMGKPMIQLVCEQAALYFEDVLISAGDARRYAFLNIPMVCDEVAGQGPLRGIASALAISRHDLNFVMACDIPWINTQLLWSLLREAHDCDCVVPISAQGYYEPLFAIYRKSALSGMLRALQDGERRVISAFHYCQVRTVTIPAQGGLSNINTMEDYWQLVHFMEAKQKKCGASPILA